MKKSYALCILMIMIIFAVGTDSLKVKAEVLTEKEEKEKDYLLHGFNALAQLEISKKESFMIEHNIIDPNSDYLSKHVRQSSKSPETQYKYYWGSSIMEISNEYTQDIGLGIFGNIFFANMNLAASFDTAKKQKNAVEERYEMYSAYIDKYYYKADLKVKDIRDNYLDPQFKRDLKAVDSKAKAEELFDTYGTHLFTGLKFGGRINITNYSISTSKATSVYSGLTLKEKVSVALQRNSAGTEFSIEETYKSESNTETSHSYYNCSSCGGDSIGHFTIDQLFKYKDPAWNQKGEFVFDTFFDAINEEKDLSIVGVPERSNAIPVWEFLDEEDIKARNLLIQCYVELCDKTYDEYVKSIASAPLKVDPDPKKDEPTLLGVYVRTPEGYMYYVDKSDLKDDGSHNVFHEEDILYLNISNPKNVVFNYNVSSNCKPINEKQGIFQVEKKKGSRLEISVKYDDKYVDWISLKVEKRVFEGGTGSEDYPYIIVNKEQFLNIGGYLDKCFCLYSDIDFENKEPLSCFGHFEGTFDGNYCKLSNFTISPEGLGGVWGLFTKNDGTIKNLTIVNAGTSLKNSDFEAGGINYKSDYMNSNYTLNSTNSKNAGIICAENNGTIDNCYLENVYIRNVIIGGKDYAESEKLAINVGSVAGINTGKISNCMVRNARILASHINLDNVLDGDIGVFVGGLVGRLQGGKIQSCVVELGGNSSIISQNYNFYGKGLANSSLKSFSAGFAGYCTDSIEISDSYVYVRKENESSLFRAIDSDYSVRNRGELKEFNSLRSVSCICDVDCKIDGNANYVVSKDEMLKAESIKPRKNGDISGPNGSEVYDTISGLFTSMSDQNSDQRVRTLTNKSTSLEYDNGTGSISKVVHILQSQRKEYMSISVDVTKEDQLKTELYNGQLFCPYGLSLIRSIDGLDDENLNVYKIRLYESKSSNDNIVNKNLYLGKNYYVNFSLYNNDKDTISIRDDIRLDVKKAEYIGIAILNPETIYMDEVDNYEDSWQDKVELYVLSNNGNYLPKKLVSNGDEIFDNLEISFDKKKVAVGENEITVTCNGKIPPCKYILTIKERSIDSIRVLEDKSEEFFKKEFVIGETIKKENLSGLVLEVTYSEGPKKIITDLTNCKEIEIIDGVIKVFENTDDKDIPLIDGSYSKSEEGDSTENQDILQGEIVIASASYKSPGKLGIKAEKMNQVIPEPTPTDPPSPPVPDPVYKYSVSLDKTEIKTTKGDKFTLNANISVFQLLDGNSEIPVENAEYSFKYVVTTANGQIVSDVIADDKNPVATISFNNTGDYIITANIYDPNGVILAKAIAYITVEEGSNILPYIFVGLGVVLAIVTFILFKKGIFRKGFKNDMLTVEKESSENLKSNDDMNDSTVEESTSDETTKEEQKLL